MADCGDLVTNQDLADSKISADYQKLWTSAVNEFEINPWTGLQNITFKGIEVAWDNQSQQIQDDADELIASLGGIDKGDYSLDPTIDLYSEYVVYDRAGATTGPELWKALPPRGGNPGTPLPYNIDSTTYPHPSNDPNLTPFSDITKDGAEKIAQEEANAGDSQLAGGNIWPLSSQESAQVGDSGLVDVLFLSRRSPDHLYLISKKVSGDITSLDFNALTATIGGESVTLQQINSSYNTYNYDLIAEGAIPSDAVFNTNLINSLISSIPSGSVITIPPGVKYNSEDLIDSYQITIVDVGNKNTLISNVRVGDYAPGHLTVYGVNGSGVWAIPSDYDKNLNPQTASFKAFHDDFVSTETSTYRVSIYTADVDNESLGGVGSSRIDTKGSGEFFGTNPDILLSQRDGEFQFLRLMTIPYSGVNPTINNYDPYFFNEKEVIWGEGQNVVTGDLRLAYGRVIEAQNDGITGANRPRHGSYRQGVLSVDDGTKFSIGEYIKDITAGDTPNLYQAFIRDIQGNDLYLEKESRAVWDLGWQQGNTIQGFTNNNTSPILSVGDNVFSYTGTGDYDVNYENEMSFTGEPVPGLLQSDGLISWKFIDDIKDFVPSQGPLKKRTLIGDIESKKFIPEASQMIHIQDPIVFYEEAPISLWHNINENTLDISRTTTAGIQFQIPGSNNRVFYEPNNNYMGFDNVALTKSRATSTSDSTPSVKGVNAITLVSPGNNPITITRFDDGLPYQEVIVRAGSNGITLQDNSNIDLGGSDILLTNGQTIKLMTFDNASRFQKISEVNP